MNHTFYVSSLIFLFIISCSTRKQTTKSTSSDDRNSVTVENRENVKDGSQNNQDKIEFKGKGNKVKVVNENSADLSKDSKDVVIIEGDGNEIEINNTNTVDMSEGSQDTVIIKANNQKVRIDSENIVDYSDSSSDTDVLDFTKQDAAWLKQNGRSPQRAAEIGEQFYETAQYSSGGHADRYRYSDIAVAYLFVAAQQGNAGAQYRLGDIFFYGKLNEYINEYLADYWLKKAAAAGHPEAITFLKEHKLNPKPEEIEPGKKLLDLYAHKLPSPASLPVAKQVELGKFLYERGSGRAPELVINSAGEWSHCGQEAMRYLEPAAKAGNVDAQFMMGHIYYAGYFHVDIDDVQAEQWLLKAAGQGHAEAEEILGFIKAIREAEKEEAEPKE